jgi:peptide subunit release factor 1 (eRF1)
VNQFLSEIRALAASPDASASVYLDLQSIYPVVDTAEDIALRWRALATRLTDEGADEPTVTAIGADVARRPAAPARYVGFASQGSVRHSRVLPGTTGDDRARFGHAAELAPLLAFGQEHPSYVKVLADRAGADISVVPVGSASGPATDVAGPDDEIERNAPGGWAQARYQRRAIDSWQHNAAVVAEAVNEALRQVDAHLLLVGGDVRAVQLLRERLGETIHDGVTVDVLPGGRQAGSSGPAQQAAVAQAVSHFAADRTGELIDRFQAGHGQAGSAVESIEPTLAALAEGRVETLLVVDDASDDRLAWFGPDVLCAPTRERAGRDPWSGRLVDIAVRAAVLTGAAVRVVPADEGRGPVEGLGGLRRY